MPAPKVFLFWDNSNIFIGAKAAGVDRDGHISRGLIRIHFANIIRLALAGRTVEKAVAVGSIPPGDKLLWNRMKTDTGITPELYERGVGSGTEQGLDQCLQTHMLRALSDYRDPQITVLMTGDGAGYDEGAGFHADLERMYKRGWGIEVISWDHCCKKALKSWAERVGVYVKLEDYYDAVTFVEGVRDAKILSLTRRPIAKVVEGKLEPDPASIPPSLGDDEEKQKLRRELEELKRRFEKEKFLRRQDRKQKKKK